MNIPGLLLALLIASALGWLGGRLLGLRQSWPRATIAAMVGIAVGGSFAAAISMQTYGRYSSANPLTIFIIALLTTMAISALLELLARQDRVHSTRPQRAAIPRPLRAVRRRIDHAQRYAQIAWIAARHGLSPYLRGRRAHAVLDSPGSRSYVAHSLRSALEEAGGVFVKLGQVLSTRHDLLPPAVIAELAGLQDRVPAAPYAEIEALLLEELGAPPTRIFATFDPEPLAAASIAQVYRAQLTSGEQVVVKVQRPGIRTSIERDLDILLALARSAEARAAWAREFRVVDLATRFAEVVREELDFRIEARNITTVAAAMGQPASVHVPAIHAHLSTSRVLVIEWLDGVSVRDAGPLLDQIGSDRVALARALLRCMTRQMLFDGTFHADPHPGNVLVLHDGRLALIDFGLVGRLDVLQQAALRGMLAALERRNAAMLRDALLDIAEARAGSDEVRLERALAQLMARRLGPRMTPGPELFADLFQIMLDFGLVFPPEIGGVFRAMVTLEGTLMLLAPGFSVIDEARALAVDWLQESLAPASLRDAALDELLALAPVLRRLPRRLDRIAAAVERGDLTIKLHPFADPQGARFLSRLVSQVVLAFLGAAIALTAALLLGTTGGPALTGSLSMLHGFGYLGLAIGIVLILRVIVTVTREQR